VTVTFGTEAPEGSVMVPVSPDVPDDWAINDGTHSGANSKTAINCTHRNFLNFIDFPLLNFRKATTLFQPKTSL